MKFNFQHLKDTPVKPEVRRKLLESAKKAGTLDDLEKLYELAVAIALCRVCFVKRYAHAIPGNDEEAANVISKIAKGEKVEPFSLKITA